MSFNDNNLLLEIAKILKVNIVNYKPTLISGFSIDTRKIQLNNIFIAIDGVNFNAHNFLHTIKNTAGGFIINSDFYNKNKPFCDILHNLLIVDNTLVAMQNLAKHNAEIFLGNKIALTGSVGKTTLKEMLSFCLSLCSKTFKTSGNFNNNIGVPFCLLELNNLYKNAVIEMGMSSAGEIDFLSNIVKPNIAIITKIAYAHSQFFSSINEIAKAKSEILNHLNSKSRVVLNADDDFFVDLQNYALSKTQNVYSVSFNNKSANAFIIESNFVFNSIKDYYIEVKANIFDEIITFKLKTIYFHNILFALFSLLVVKLLKYDINLVANNLHNFNTPAGRGDIVDININNKQFTLVNDSYNASPSSMVSGLNSIKFIDKNKILILGEMRELGEFSRQNHEQLSEIVEQIDAKYVFLFGKEMLYLKEKLGHKSNVVYFTTLNNNNLDALWQDFFTKIMNDNLVFIKGSFGSNVHLFAQKLINNNQTNEYNDK